ncbi:phBC6A51 family helix-turn-helix protein [Clostridium tagluense]|uniref:phBC6A51 family helix-turn-helix protein n=1 Tax=Clostridium tagluense TaxID=360422 RepID=UPI001CF2A153|nr:phBC6A51 family helix-turn-helix protein [Clostridium tagluense]MCB2300381.1 hypothetical protein [Clostridium tagluense]
MLDERKIKAALMKAQGIDVVKIAPEVGISRATYYNWEKAEEFTDEVNRCRQEFIIQSSNRLAYLTVKAVNVLDEQMDSEDEKRSFDAASKVLDKTIPNMSKLTLDDGRDNKDKVNIDVLDAEINEIDAE